MNWLDQLAELVPPADTVADISPARELVEVFLGFGLPDEYVELSRRYGSGEFGLVAGGFSMYSRLLGVHEMFLDGPSWSARDRYFRDSFDRDEYAPVEEVKQPVTRLDLGIAADWPFWPEGSSALPVAESDEGSQMYLLRHLEPERWRVGWNLRDTGVIETSAGLSEWLYGWLAQKHSREGRSESNDWPASTEIQFRPNRHKLVVARLEASEATLEIRRAALTQASISPLRSPLATDMTKSLSECQPLPYAAAGWQRLDFRARVGQGQAIRCWYDDAVDGSGNHRVGALVRSDHPEDRDVVGVLASALDSPIIEIDEM